MQNGSLRVGEVEACESACDRAAPEDVGVGGIDSHSVGEGHRVGVCVDPERFRDIVGGRGEAPFSGGEY